MNDWIDSLHPHDGETPHAVYIGDRLYWLGLAESVDHAWRIALGYPTRGEVRRAKARGFRCVAVSVTPADAAVEG